MTYQRLLKSAIFLFAIHVATTASSQSIQQQKMQALAFMVGDWVGTSKSISEQGTTEIPAFQQIQYKIDSSILTIDLLSESLLIHTVIYYDEQDKTYYYNPYYKTGTAKYRGEIINGKFRVTASDTKRFIFERLADGRFREYGEKLIDGKWQTYFEDTFSSM